MEPDFSVLKKSTSYRGRLSENSWQGIVFRNITITPLKSSETKEIREALTAGIIAHNVELEKNES